MGSKNQGQTQRIEPPSYQLPYLQAGLQRAEQLYSGGGQYGGSVPSVVAQPSQSRTMTALERRFGRRSDQATPLPGGPSAPPGTIPPPGSAAPGSGQPGVAPIAPFTPDQIASQDMIRNRATNGDPTINAASGYARSLLAGDFLNGNPWADAAFEKARLATQGGLASEFARSGRNVDQSEGLRAQQLNDLATSIYGGMYENERNRMQGVLPYVQQLGNQSYVDAAALGGSGAQQQGQQQSQLDAPGTALDQYLARVRGTDYGSTTSMPGGGFSGGGALGGAMLGNMLFPGLGGIIGGGLLGGLF